MSLLIEVFLSLAAIGLISTVAVIGIGRMLFGRVRRSPAISGAALRARIRTTVGPQRDVLKQRLRLAETLDSGQAAVDLAARTDSPHAELRRLYRRILDEGAALQAQLQLLESERDAAVLSEAIPAAARRVDQVALLVRRVRAAVAAGLGDRSDDNLAALYADADREIAALAAGVRELHLLNGYDLSGDDRTAFDRNAYDRKRHDITGSDNTRLTRGDLS